METGSDGENHRSKENRFPLRSISGFGDELRSQANRLLDIADTLEDVGVSCSTDLPQAIRRPHPLVTLDIYALAKKAYEQRRARDGLIDADLLGETAWDILLDLVIAHGDNRLLSVTSVCIGSASQATTALRWINILEERGLVYRVPDATDRRRSWVKITPKGLDRMKKYFKSVETLF